MKFVETEIKGAFVIDPVVHGDNRGYFFESFSLREFEDAVGPVHFVQDNESKSCYGVVRGLHFQKGDDAQAKLVRCVRGRILDVAVDIRPLSPTYGKWISAELSEDNHRMLFIPRGFAHGFSVLSPEAVFQYKCDNFYAPLSEAGISWNDPGLGIDWKVPLEDVILSDKDRSRPCLKDLAPN